MGICNIQESAEQNEANIIKIRSFGKACLISHNYLQPCSLPIENEGKNVDF